MRRSSDDYRQDSDPNESRTIRRRRFRSSLRFSESISYPKSVLFIIVNEFCERFTYYGVNTILALYFKNELYLSDNTATVIYHVYVMFCYFFPLLGAILADSWLGKYRTIVYLSLVYVTGEVTVTIGAIPGVPALILTLIGLCLIATGTGCIKPCVSAFGGDQFVMPQQENHLKKFFSIFYFTINAGSFISSILTPLLRQVACFGESSCYTLAFGVPSTLMILATVVFVLGTRFYKRKKPEVNVIWQFCKLVTYALKKHKKGRGPLFDSALDKFDQKFIDDVRAALRVLVLFIPLPFFWALFDQQGSRWTFQASRMNGDIGAMKLQADQMQVINPILILVFIPLFEAFVYPAFAKYNLLKKPLQRLTVGGLLAALAFVVSAVVEYKLEPTYAVLPKPHEAQIRLYNGLPERLEFKFIDPDYEPEFIEKLNFWKKFDIPAKGETPVKIKYTVKGTEKTETLYVHENALTSYVITADKIIHVPHDAPDRTEDGFPKFMLIYIVPTKPTTVTVDACGKKYDFTVTAAQPFSEYKKLDDECDSYSVEMGETELVEKLKLRQGGVYVALILQSGESPPEAQLLTVVPPNSVHMLWLVPQFVIITAAEVMFSITGLEFSFTQAPVSMKALMQAAWLLTVAAGNLIVAIIAQAKLFDRQLHEFILFAVLMTVDMFIFAIVASRYKYATVKEEPEVNPRL